MVNLDSKLQIKTKIKEREKALKRVMHSAIDKYIEHINHYIDFIHDRTTPEFKTIPAELKEVLDGFGVDELKKFHVTKLMHDEESVIEHYARQIIQADNPSKMLENIFDMNLFVSQDVYLGRVFKFSDSEKQAMHKIADEITTLKSSLEC